MGRSLREEKELIQLETGLGLIEREWVGNGKRIVRRWTVLWEEEIPISSRGGSRYWFGQMKSDDGQLAFRILELDVRGVAHHITVAKEEMFHFMVEMSLFVHEFERMNDGQPTGRLSPIRVPRHEAPRLMRLKEEMIPGAENRTQFLSYCPGHLGAGCDGKIHTCNLCGARIGWCLKNHEGYEYLR